MYSWLVTTSPLNSLLTIVINHYKWAYHATTNFIEIGAQRVTQANNIYNSGFLAGVVLHRHIHLPGPTTSMWRREKPVPTMEGHVTFSLVALNSYITP